MSYIGTPPARRILSSSDIAQGAVTLDDINFTDVPANMDITGVIDKHTMRLADGVTITGDVTISEDLVLAKLSDDGDAITMTPDSTTRTITGSGSIQAATVAQTPQPTQTYAVGTTLTGLTGVIGSEVTGGAGLDGAQTSVADGSITLAKMAADSVDSDQYVNGSIDTDHIGDDQVTLAKMATGTDGQIITYDVSGNPVAVGPGTDGQVLTSTGAGSPPAFEDAAAACGGVGAAGWTEDGWRFITSTSYDYEAHNGGHATGAHMGDFDRQQHKGSNITESAGEITMATAGLYAVSCLLIEDHSASYELTGHLIHTDVSNSNTEIWYEPPIFADKGSNMSSLGHFTWFVNVGAGDKVHMRLRGYLTGNWCGSGSPSSCFQGCRVG